MKILVTTCAVMGALTLSAGTASAQNATYCHNQAVAYANQVANPAGGALAGGAIGGLAGVVAGAVLGQGSGAKVAGGLIGGTAGAVAGASNQKKKQQAAYNEEYARCMNIATPAYYEVPPAGSPQWNQGCSLKYKSFRPSDGTFQPLPDTYGNYPPRRPCVLP